MNLITWFSKKVSSAIWNRVKDSPFADWLGKQSGSKVQARTPGTKLGVIEDAPGSYVKVKS